MSLRDDLANVRTVFESVSSYALSASRLSRVSAIDAFVIGDVRWCARATFASALLYTMHRAYKLVASWMPEPVQTPGRTVIVFNQHGTIKWN